MGILEYVRVVGASWASRALLWGLGNCGSVVTRRECSLKNSFGIFTTGVPGTLAILANRHKSYTALPCCRDFKKITCEIQPELCGLRKSTGEEDCHPR